MSSKVKVKTVEKIKNFFVENPEYLLWAIAVIFALISISAFSGRGWGAKPSGRRDKWLYSKLGPIGYRIFNGVIFMILAALFAWFGTLNPTW